MVMTEWDIIDGKDCLIVTEWDIIAEKECLVVTEWDILSEKDVSDWIWYLTLLGNDKLFPPWNWSYV